MSANRLMELVTVQTHPFKNLTEALKDILKDVNIEFSEEGMKLVTLDPATQTILVHLKLEAEKFVEYKCEGKIVIGINLTNFYKLIKTITNNDTLTLFIDKNNKHQLGIRIENGDKNTLTTYTLNLMEIDENTLEIDPPEFQSIVVLPSNEFNTVCKNMALLSQKLNKYDDYIHYLELALKKKYNESILFQPFWVFFDWQRITSNYLAYLAFLLTFVTDISDNCS